MFKRISEEAASRGVTASSVVIEMLYAAQELSEEDDSPVKRNMARLEANSP
jgi:hypothetical protein